MNNLGGKKFKTERRDEQMKTFSDKTSGDSLILVTETYGDKDVLNHLVIGGFAQLLKAEGGQPVKVRIYLRSIE